MSITVSSRGSFEKTLRFLRKIHSLDFMNKLEEYGMEGVEALRAATPRDSGVTAESWSYEIHRGMNEVSVVWTNDNNNHGVNIVMLIQYGHATRNGGYIQGRDFINPTMRPIFDKMTEELWGEVSS